jgi:hypothetical protein
MDRILSHRYLIPLSQSLLIKRCLVIVLPLLVFCSGANAQSTTGAPASVPQLFNYTTQVTDSTGAPIGNTPVNIQLSLLSGSPTGPVVYSELNSATTSPAGIFSVVVGGGTIIAGNLNNVPWTSGNIYLQVSMAVGSNPNYANMGSAQLISQPYAFVSGNGVTAVNFDSTGKTILTTANGSSGISSTSNAWITNGNSGVGTNGYIGTNDASDLVLKRNRVEGLRLGANQVTAAGNLSVGGNSTVAGNSNVNGNSGVAGSLNVTGNSNVNGNSGVAGSSVVGGNLGVAGVTTPLTAADVNGALALRDTVIYANGSFTLNTSTRSSFLVYAGSSSAAACSLTNGVVPGQLLMIMVSQNLGNNNGISFAPGGNVRIAGGHGNGNSSVKVSDGGVITFIWNGTAWLQTSFSNNN